MYVCSFEVVSYFHSSSSSSSSSSSLTSQALIDMFRPRLISSNVFQVAFVYLVYNSFFATKTTCVLHTLPISPQFDRPNKVCWAVQVTNVLSMQFAPLPLFRPPTYAQISCSTPSSLLDQVSQPYETTTDRVVITWYVLDWWRLVSGSF
jgi:hypothetical protein